MSTMNGERLPLGVGNLIGQTFKTFSLRIPGFIVLAGVPALVFMLMIFFFLGAASFATDNIDEASTADLATLTGGLGAMVVIGLVGLVIYFVFGAAIAHLAADLSVGAAQGLPTYIGLAFRNLLPILILNTLSVTAATIGMIFLVVPGLWIIALFSMVSVSIVAEGAGFSAFRRSIELTRGYRWPIVGGFYVMLVIAGIFSAIAELVFGFIPVVGPLLAFGVQMTIYGLLPIWFGLAYARLRLIKDGAGINRVDEVFA